MHTVAFGSTYTYITWMLAIKETKHLLFLALSADNTNTNVLLCAIGLGVTDKAGYTQPYHSCLFEVCFVFETGSREAHASLRLVM